MDDAIEALMRVVAALEKLNINYVIGGSYASSAHGEARSTNDIDILATISVVQALALAAELRDEFYADEQAIERNVRAKRHFNVIDTDTMFKIDIFPDKGSEFDRQQLERRQIVVVDPTLEFSAYVTTPEDTVLAKLQWYRFGCETSDLQWRDIMGVLKLRRESLDLGYLRVWAAQLSVSDLLTEALADAGIRDE